VTARVDAPGELTLLDWKRRVFELYAEVRAARDPALGWRHWRDVRDDLFRSHPQSPLADDRRAAFAGLPYFEYDAAFRVVGRVEPAERERLLIPASGEDETVAFGRFARVSFELAGAACALDLYWLEGYGGGVFLPFADGTRGRQTYGAGRYLLDTVKGSDLGASGDELVLDFNFAYNPSCAYDPRWVCPLAPPSNRLAIAVEAGERYA
jgi:uncharacterized protein (DUF1684 family)